MIKKSSFTIFLFLMVFQMLGFSIEARASCRLTKAYVPVAMCSTEGTHIPLPYFVCCQLHDYKGQLVWRNMWVPTACQNADLRATYDVGCKTTSPVYGMGSSIIGHCQFSYSTCI